MDPFSEKPRDRPSSCGVRGTSKPPKPEMESNLCLSLPDFWLLPGSFWDVECGGVELGISWGSVVFSLEPLRHGTRRVLQHTKRHSLPERNHSGILDGMAPKTRMTPNTNHSKDRRGAGFLFVQVISGDFRRPPQRAPSLRLRRPVPGVLRCR